MASYFEKKLIDLLPPLYRERDGSGDLQALLNVPAASLDELKELIDRFPELFDVDRCEDRFLLSSERLLDIASIPLPTPRPSANSSVKPWRSTGVKGLSRQSAGHSPTSVGREV